MQKYCLIGKKFGKKFKPYEAIKIGEKLSKALNALPAVLAALDIIVDFVKFVRAGKSIEKFEAKKAELLKSINSIETDISEMIEAELDEYYSTVSDPLNNTIKEESENFEKNTAQINLYESLSKKIDEHQNLRLSL